jgi:hypothetical protein
VRGTLYWRPSISSNVASTPKPSTIPFHLTYRATFLGHITTPLSGSRKHASHGMWHGSYLHFNISCQSPQIHTYGWSICWPPSCTAAASPFHQVGQTRTCRERLLTRLLTTQVRIPSPGAEVTVGRTAKVFDLVFRLSQLPRSKVTELGRSARQ